MCNVPENSFRPRKEETVNAITTQHDSSWTWLYNSTVIYSLAQGLRRSLTIQNSLLFSILFHFLLSFNPRWSYRHMPSRYLNLYSTLSLQLASTHSFHSYGLGGIEDWKWHTGESFFDDWSVMNIRKHHSILHLDGFVPIRICMTWKSVHD